MLSYVHVLTVLLLSVLFLTAHASVSPPAPAPRFIKKQYKTIRGRRMAYVEVGTGDPIVFLHGNPTSSYLWRNVMPSLEGMGRLIAPDLIGMGDSDKISTDDPLRYTYLQHSNYLFELLEKLDVKTRVTFVIHDWGSAIGFLWAYNNRFDPNAVKGIAFMEAIVAEFPSDGLVPTPELGLVLSLRDPKNEGLVLQDNVFIEKVLPGSIIRNLTKGEFDEYRRPFLMPGEGRRTMVTFPQQLPLNGQPMDVVQIIRTYSKWLATSSVPKLFIRGEPGLILVGPLTTLVRGWKNVKEVAVKGIHYVQEDSPREIGMAVKEWLSGMTN